MAAAYIRVLLKRLAVRAGIEKRVHAHGLRHTHATGINQNSRREDSDQDDGVDTIHAENTIGCLSQNYSGVAQDITCRHKKGG